MQMDSPSYKTAEAFYEALLELNQDDLAKISQPDESTFRDPEEDESEVSATEHNPYQRRRDPRNGELYYVHRAIAEWKLGRALNPGEVVHHDNGDKRDNHPDNVWVFSCQRAHMLYENYRLRERQGIMHLFLIETLLEREGLWVVS